MIGPTCTHERDVLDLVAVGQWPQRASTTLRAHVTSCSSCAEVAAIAAAVREWDDSEAMPHVPDAAVVWRRAQMRAHEAAARTASRPIWAAQVAAVAGFVAALVWIGPSAGWYGSAWQSLTGAVPQMASMPTVSLWPDGLSLSSLMSGWGRVALLTLGGVALLASLVAAAVRMSERAEISDR
ncbi:MAG TPA: hypothetical protein PKW63_12455 [Vicinamibacterales bacterium]|nr:hypothetical protein [Vicinamibacterales bacterium]